MRAEDGFFAAPHAGFFKPLNGSLRELTVSAIRALYLRVNGPDADYDYSLTKKDVDDIIAGAIRHGRILNGDGAIEGRVPESDLNDRAVQIRRALEDAGWIERYKDAGSMRIAYRFTARGRQFSAPFVEDVMDNVSMIQNTRSTLSHLNTFYSRAQSGEISVVDLIIAARFSADIINDFNQIIQELVEKKRRIAESASKDLERAREVGEDFFTYLDSRFLPDLSIRFNEDSVERFRTDILNTLQSIRTLPDEVRAEIEYRLRTYYPFLRENNPSILLWALDRIEHAIIRACEAKLPELRQETRHFTRRAQALLRHLRRITFEGDDETIGQSIQRLAQLPKERVDAILDAPGTGLAAFDIQLIDPGRIKLTERKARVPIDTAIEDEGEPDMASLYAERVRQALETTFQVDREDMAAYIIDRLAGGYQIRASQMPVRDVRSLITLFHAMELGAVGDHESPFRVEVLETEFENDYFQGRDYLIEYLPAQERRANA